MPTPDEPHSAWPALPYAAWRDSAQTLHLWMQVVGKLRLALTPWVNHGWNVPLYVNSRGVGTSPMGLPDGRLLEVDFDFVRHALHLRCSDGAERGFALAPMTVAEFHRRFFAELQALGVQARLSPLPSELPDPVPFASDERPRAYDAARVHDYWRALVQVDRVMRTFRSGFLGKCSPVHLFWGAMDLAVTRFSGRVAPEHPGGIAGLPDSVTREAYSHEVSSAGFWPGSDAYPHAAFYSYAYPSPPGFDSAAVGPAAAQWSSSFGEWLLPYDAVRESPDPDAALLAFFESSYRAAAALADWGPGLTCGYGETGRPRTVAGKHAASSQ